MTFDAIKSFFSNYSERAKKPFGGTFIAVWVIHNWKVFLIIFDDELDYSNKVSELQNYINDAGIAYLLLAPLGYAFLAAVIYPLLDLLGLGINAFYTRKGRKKVLSLIGYDDYIPKNEHDKLKDELEVEKNKIKELSAKYYKVLDDQINSIEERTKLSEIIANEKTLFSNNIESYTKEIKDKDDKIISLQKDLKAANDTNTKLTTKIQSAVEKQEMLERNDYEKYVTLSAFNGLSDFIRFYEKIIPNVDFSFVYRAISDNPNLIKTISNNNFSLHSSPDILFLGSGYTFLKTSYTVAIDDITSWNNVKQRNKRLRGSWVSYTNRITQEEAIKGGVYHYLYMFSVVDVGNLKKAARLTVFADDYAEISINKAKLLDTTLFDFSTGEVKVLEITPKQLYEGVNFLYFKIQNHSTPDSDPDKNPTGFIFSLEFN